VGPDNGLFTPFIHERLACVALTNPTTHRQPVSATFHGRDIFAPVAAHLFNGLALADLGPAVDDPVLLANPQPVYLPDGRLRAEVVYVDHFGNLITNVGPVEWGAFNPAGIRVVVGGTVVPLHRTYAEVPPGSLLALIGSDGHLEIAVREGSAAEHLEVGVGAEVEVWGV
jgi:S-adenosylmethionine hydrolase